MEMKENPVRTAPPGSRSSILAIAILTVYLAACASSHGLTKPPAATPIHRMPSDLGSALAPEDADPGSAAQLAESALHVLSPRRAGGPDYTAAARICLIASETAHPKWEKELSRACDRVAARSALRSGRRDLYLEAVQRWEAKATPGERMSGELALHRMIRDRLSGQSSGASRPLPPELATLFSRSITRSAGAPR